MHESNEPENPMATPEGGASNPPPLPQGGAPEIGGPPPLPPLGRSSAPAFVGQSAGGPSGEVWRGSNSSSRGCVIGALAMGVFIGLSFFLAYYMINNMEDFSETMDRTVCAEQLIELHGILSTFASEHNGEYPGMASGQSFMMFGGDPLASLDLALLQCPAEPTDESGILEDGSIQADSDYLYLGYLIREQADVDRVAEALYEREGDWNRVRDDLQSGALAGLTPLNAGMEGAAEIPLLVEWPEFHWDGVHVLYLDGHVEFVPYGEKFPVTEEFFDAMDDIGELQQ